MGQPQGVFVSGVWFGAGRVARLDESFSSLGLDEVDAESWDRRGAVLLVGFADAVGQSGNAGLLEVLVHEGVDNGVVKAVEEADGLDDGDDHVHRDAVVFVLQIVVLKKHVDGVERRPANREQQDNGDHHLHCPFLLP